ncbi:MAG: 23S rRNA (adenine(2030)-N(6))-methyltransferase RlmJ, partial [Proteobacteria bacterium]|nr:23S rRNA (adenine(2030)-N(6))-methyltransferase RlmJ [Pseudomonadota bacterium]
MRAMHYRHAYHAGNFADVWKHAIVFGILDALNRKATPWSYVESHAGAGHYLLSGEAASKTEEWRDGIGRLRAASGAPELAARFLEATSRIGACPPWGNHTHLCTHTRRTGDFVAVQWAAVRVAPWGYWRHCFTN